MFGFMWMTYRVHTYMFAWLRATVSRIFSLDGARTTAIDSIPQIVLDECCQLTKANSIEGSKRDSVEIVYTPWRNLMKDITMATGTIGFKNHKTVKKIRNVTRDRQMVTRLEKTKTQVTIDFEAARLKRDREELQKQKEGRKKAAQEEKKKEELDREAYRQKHYLDLREQPGVTNELKGDGTIANCREMEDDFM
eukprot:Gregarina_sp_Poly_1__887@NODE_1211_length_4771_cov_58_034226_g62_i1_p2_GENE_NODE_1211_length_4771_cov_58_034226_g62_i1NODE_1211_length_4771_cov_58_034226_g62_i1_p2_ORF_typecomplete_len194_score31_17NFACTR_1/PF05670_13/1_5e14RlaP/PF10127_9/0_011MCU/PF04678_13/0_094GED/PF02212_18/2_3e02GED/PF02212_18/6_2TMEM247/PF15444_6/0_43Peptidase_S49_N/PF08496_10/2_2_NODE_1211_length_4771_cov_58_034226_g62_i12583